MVKFEQTCMVRIKKKKKGGGGERKERKKENELFDQKNG